MKQELLEMVQVTVPSSYGQKTLIFTNFTNNVKKCIFWPYLLKFSDFIRLKKIITVTINHFQLLLSHTFPPLMNFIFFGLSADAAYFKSRFPGWNSHWNKKNQKLWVPEGSTNTKILQHDGKWFWKEKKTSYVLGKPQKKIYSLNGRAIKA